LGNGYENGGGDGGFIVLVALGMTEQMSSAVSFNVKIY